MTDREPTLADQIEACESARAFLSIGMKGGKENDLCVALRAAAATLRSLEALDAQAWKELMRFHSATPAPDALVAEIDAIQSNAYAPQVKVRVLLQRALERLTAELKTQNEANDMLGQERDAFQQQAKQDREDAERYRWLRTYGHMDLCVRKKSADGLDFIYEEPLDAAIDAARKTR